MPDAFEKVVDRLLSSPQYGVRWGRHWMDVSRYADTSDGPDRFAFSYTYRDWVVRAFNEDMPFDQFAKKQIAADQLTPFVRRPTWRRLVSSRWAAVFPKASMT